MYNKILNVSNKIKRNAVVRLCIYQCNIDQMQRPIQNKQKVDIIAFSGQNNFPCGHRLEGTILLMISILLQHFG